MYGTGNEIFLRVGFDSTIIFHEFFSNQNKILNFLLSFLKFFVQLFPPVVMCKGHPLLFPMRKFIFRVNFFKPFWL